MERIPVAGPWITQKEIDYVTDAVTNAWYDNANVYHDRFEKAFAQYVGVRHAVALPSCTSAIHLALLALGIGRGDEVIVPDITWIATSAPISYVGATTVFADIDEKTWCLSAESFEKCITRRTKAVIPVDLYGGVPDWDEIRDIAKRKKIHIIEDAAQAIGSEYKGRKAGSFGRVGVFSFHGSKTLTTGEGGMLVTDDGKIKDRILFLRDHGRAPGKKMFWNTEVAYKYKMSALQAALGLGQLERIEELLSRKIHIFNLYKKRLGSISGLTLNYELPCSKNTFWMVTVIPDRSFGIKKETIIHELRKKGIDSRPFFYPLSSLPAYRNLRTSRRARMLNNIAYDLSQRGVNLPSSLNLTEEQVAYVCRHLTRILLR